MNNFNRREFFTKLSTFGVGAFLSPSLLPQVLAKIDTQTNNLFNFHAISTSTADKLRVPKGYNAQVLISWGDPIFKNSPKFDSSGNANAISQELQFGDNNDGMALFHISDTRSILVVNNEYTNVKYLYNHKGKYISADDVKKAQAAVGVSIIEIKKINNHWQLDINSAYNRRITANTPMTITGAAAGDKLLKTSQDSSGMSSLGTFANCSMGVTPWGSYLTCEENFDKFFDTKDKITLSARQKRYGLLAKNNEYQWYKYDNRFDLAAEPNEANRFGWIVEIDPKDPKSIPKKRTALGRFKHENAAVVLNADNSVIIYMGDDEKGEFIYKFIAKDKYNPQQSNTDLLSEGRLFVAKFNYLKDAKNGSGSWLELSYGKNGLTKKNGFNSQAEVLIYTREAATIVGATAMDRPEWLAVHPDNNSIYCTLTNNNKRGKSSSQPVGGPNPRLANKYGQIIRWQPKDGDHTNNNFVWDLYLIAGNPLINKNDNITSANINTDNLFNSPDGISFDTLGRLWIQTDGNTSNTGDFKGMGNNQMLCGDPLTGEIRRFLTAPIGAEVTGLTFSSDNKTMFVGIQHPGDKKTISNFPQGGTSKPRSSIMAISRDDGGLISA